MPANAGLRSNGVSENCEKCMSCEKIELQIVSEKNNPKKTLYKWFFIIWILDIGITMCYQIVNVISFILFLIYIFLFFEKSFVIRLL